MRPESAGWFNQTYIAEFATKEQQEALLNNNEDDLRQADDRALAEAILASLAEESRISRSKPAEAEPDSTESFVSDTNEPDNSGTASVNITPSQTEYEASRNINQRLAAWFDHHGFQIVKNSGKDANCLLISMTQHATGNFESEHSAEVASLREEVKAYTKKHHPHRASMNDHSLYSDGKIMAQLVTEINKKISDKDKQLTFWIATADHDGQPGWRKVGDGPKMAIIFDQAGHYEAVIPRKISSTRRPAPQPPR